MATTEFIDAAAVQSRALGTDPAYVFVPHPVQDRTDDELKKMADQAISFGAKSVFYDQMGSGEQPNWDLSKEFPIPTVKTIGVKGKVLGELHDYIDKKDKNEIRLEKEK